MNDKAIIEGRLRRYHLDGAVADHPLGTVCRAFSGRRVNNKTILRHYAVVMHRGGDGDKCRQAVEQTLARAEQPLHIEEVIRQKKNTYYVIAPGEGRKQRSPLPYQIAIAVLLAAAILALLVMRG